jgi:hypothetical protein
MDETVTEKDLDDLLSVFGCEDTSVSLCQIFRIFAHFYLCLHFRV